ncbi:MAG TPA: DUF6502 family protein [Burkholderiaceae bacterium]|nr:DUF6502 family protein [Burkholderiaceae bacterium]
MQGSEGRVQEALAQAVLRVLHALVRLLLRHGMALPAFVELAKRAYVNVAMRDFAIPGRKSTLSRAALLTGLTRKETQRLLNLPPDLGTDLVTPHNRAARVVAGWVRDSDFHGPDGEPSALEPEAGAASFAELVRRYSGDVPARAVLDELLRVGTVERDEGGRIKLLTRVYIPRMSDVGKLVILGADVSYLIDTIDHNLQGGERLPRFQRKVMYDNLPVEALDEFRQLSARHAQELIQLLDSWLARHDRDTNPAVRGSGRMRAGVGIFCFEENMLEQKDTLKDPRNDPRKDPRK